MVEKLICEGKYWFFHETIGLPISFDNLPEEIKLQGETFYFPTPFHVSLVYVGKIIEKYNISIPNFLNKTVDDFCDFTKTHNIEIISYSNEYKFVRKNNLKTLVAMCEVSNLNKFFDFINEKYMLKIKYPVPHVTIYNTIKGKPGAYLMDSDDIKNFAVTIPNPIGHSL